MTLRESLDRTLCLMREWLLPEVTDETLMGALTSTRIVLSADEEVLAQHSGQCAFVATALLLARSGHQVYLSASNVQILEPQPPLQVGRLIDSLVEVGQDILPEWEFEVGTPRKSDVAILLGQPDIHPTAEQCFYLGASRWSGEISHEPSTIWATDTSPFGGLAAAGLAAAEAFKASMRKLKTYAVLPIYDDLFAVTPGATLPLAMESVPVPTDLGRVDCISGGALTNSAIFSLARIPGVTGEFRVVDPDVSDVTNLQRYMLLRRSRCGLKKAHDLQTQALAGLEIEGIPLRYDNESRSRVRDLAPNVLVGVDHIPSRWVVQKARPGWMVIAATEGFEIMTTFHRDGMACAGCAHPEYSEPVGPLPTVAFVSFISGLMMAAMLAERLTMGEIRQDRQLTWFAPLQAHQLPSQSALAVNPSCPIHRQSDLITSLAQ